MGVVRAVFLYLSYSNLGRQDFHFERATGNAWSYVLMIVWYSMRCLCYSAPFQPPSHFFSQCLRYSELFEGATAVSALVRGPRSDIILGAAYN